MESKPKKVYRRWTDEEIREMILLYEGGKSLFEVGQENNISGTRVGSIFKQVGFKTRKHTKSDRLLKKLLEKLYVKEGLSFQKLEKKLKSTIEVIRRSLEFHQIPIRKKGDLNFSPLTEDLLKNLYLDEKLSIEKIAAQFSLNKRTVTNYLSKYGIEKYPVVEPRTEPWKIPELAVKYKVNRATILSYCKDGTFPNAYLRYTGKTKFWCIPDSDLKNFKPKKQGGQLIVNPSPAALRTRKRRWKRK
jgi:predicted DNA-binding protein YlxM (UPF0122 family)